MNNKRPVRALFDNLENLTAENIVESKILKDLLKVEVPKAIEKAFKTKSIYASIFEINNTGHYIEIHKKDWTSALESCLVFNVEAENYEACSNINNLIKEIKSSQKKPKIKIK